MTDRFDVGELLRKLAQHPVHGDEIRANIHEYQRSAAPVLNDLAEHGIILETISELLRPPERSRYEAAMPILLYWLPRIDAPNVKEEIVRTLSTKWARSVAAPELFATLVAEYRNAPPDQEFGLKWAIGNAFAVVADDRIFDDLVALVRDRRHGRAREMLVMALGNMRDSRAVDVLIELLDDDEVAGHALEPLGKLKAARARPKIEPFLSHQKAWIRKDARRALAKIDKTSNTT